MKYIIDGEHVDVVMRGDGGNLIEFSATENIFSSYRQDDLLMSYLWEGSPAPGDKECVAVVRDGSDAYLTWLDCIASDDVVIRTFNIEVV